MQNSLILQSIAKSDVEVKKFTAKTLPFLVGTFHVVKTHCVNSNQLNDWDDDPPPWPGEWDNSEGEDTPN